MQLFYCFLFIFEEHKMNKYIVLLLLAMFAMGMPLYACCGGNIIKEYEGLIGSHPIHSKADQAARDYLNKKEVASGMRPLVDDQALGFYESVDSSDFFPAVWKDIENSTTANVLSILFMYDTDYNITKGNTSGDLIQSNYGDYQLTNHALDTPSPDCHLNHSTPEDVADKALTCPHHEKHWTDYIEPEIKALITTNKEGS